MRHGLDAGTFDRVDVTLVHERAALHDDIARKRVEDVFERRAAQDALAERGHDLTGIDNRLHGEAVLGAAIGDHDDAVPVATSTRRRVR